jgi:hypothetical protein
MASGSELDMKGTEANEKKSQCCPPIIANNGLTIAAFLVNLLYFPAAYLHLSSTYINIEPLLLATPIKILYTLTTPSMTLSQSLILSPEHWWVSQ